MGTTCVAAGIVGLEMHIGHVGDSRAYLIANGLIKRLTQDHNLAEELLVAVGIGGPAGAENVLTRSLGQRDGVEVNVSEPIRLEAGNAVVLCSDGLSNMLHDEEILSAVENDVPALACSHLVELARQRGGPDNITVVIGRVQPA
jgi:protein phosphatase